MTFPSLVIGIILSSLYGAIFHLWKGGGLGRLILYLILSWIGFWVGHIVGGFWGNTFLNIGPLYFGMATLGSLVFLCVGYWLSMVKGE